MSRIVPAGAHQPLRLEHWLALRADYPDPLRILVALRLARDLEACRDLLAGKPVDPGRLERGELERAKRATLVQLVAPLELLPNAAAAA